VAVQRGDVDPGRIRDRVHAGSGATLGLIAVGLAFLAIFGWFEFRSAAPLVNMHTFMRRPVLTTNISTLLIGSAIISTFVLVPMLAQLPESSGVDFGLSATQSVLLLVPGGLLSLALAPVVGRVGEQMGSKLPFFVGCVVTAGALTGMAFAHGSVGLVILWACFVSAGVGAVFAAVPNLVVNAVDAHETGEATGVNTIMRNIGSAIGSQLAATMLAGHLVASGLPGDLGFELAFIVGAGGAFVAACACC